MPFGLRRHPPRLVAFARALPFACLVCHCGLPAPTGSGPAGRSSSTLVVLPDDGAAGLLTAVANARQRVWGEMYMLTSFDAMDALVAARAAGADVRLLLEPAPYNSEDANQGALQTLAAAGIDVRWFAVPGGLVHAKFLLVDDTAWVLTLNLTLAGVTRNREYAVADREPVDVRRLEGLWQSDAIGAPPGAGPSGAHVLTSPIDARLRLTAALDAARVSVAIEVEELSDTAFVARLIDARTRGVQVTILVPASDRSAATSAAVRHLVDAGIAVRALGAPTLHAKVMVVDNQITYLGSVNFTRASFDDNREVGLLMRDAATTARIMAVLGADWAQATPL
jgi:cardiolipin synthase